MNNIFSKISAITLSFLVLFSTLSFSVETHFCGDEAVDVSYFGNANTCETEAFSIHKNTACHLEKQEDTHSNCCTNETILVKGSNFTKPAKTKKAAFFKLVDLFVFGFVSFKIVQTYNLYNYIAPVLAYNYQIIFQNFRI